MLSVILAAHCLFSPPSDWEIADSKTPSKRIIVGFVDKSKSGFRPSLNLTYERVTIPLNEYLAIVQKNCAAKKQLWRHLGKIETQSGPAELIQIETKTPFGPVRILQAILLKNEEAFILTAGMRKADFGKHAATIESAFRSMSICEDLFEKVSNEQIREAMRKSWQKRNEDVDSFQKTLLEQKERGPA
ncbi:MAG: hypothetical protein K1000chlam2_01191 [Chlamydiae bacterium]|nr:hypothetical protein [Chlamydiota bacterium]